MTDPRPVYVVGPPGPLRGRVGPFLESLSPRAFDGVDAFVDAEPDPGVVYLLGPRLTGDAILKAVDHMAAGRGEWTPVLVRDEGGEVVARTLSLGYPHPVTETAATATGDGTSTLLELRGVLREVARIRHDINNPLTSALAESQLLLMDVRDEELRQAIETVLEQLRRIRDLVGGTVHLRPLD